MIPVISIPYAGTLDAAIASLLTLIPDVDITFWGMPSKQRRFGATLIAGVLHVTPYIEGISAEEVANALQATPPA